VSIVSERWGCEWGEDVEEDEEEVEEVEEDEDAGSFLGPDPGSTTTEVMRSDGRER
jgi:hypothetical protein